MPADVRRALARIEKLAARRAKVEHLLALHLYPLDSEDEVLIWENGEHRVVTREEARRLEASADLLIDHVQQPT